MRVKKARQLSIDAMTLVEKEHVGILDTMKDLLDSVEDFGSAKTKEARKARSKFAMYKSRYASNLVLLEQRHVVEHLVHEGLLDDLDSAPMVDTINKKIEAIMLAPLLEKINKRLERYIPGYASRQQTLARAGRARAGLRKSTATTQVVTATKQDSSVKMGDMEAARAPASSSSAAAATGITSSASRDTTTRSSIA